MIRVAIDSGPLTSGHSVRGIGTYVSSLLDGLKKESSLQNGVKIESFDFSKNCEKLSSFDLLHYPFFDLFFHTLSLFKPTKVVVTVHDVIPLLYPNHYPPGIKGKINFILQKLSLKGVEAVITDTETSRKDIARFLSVPQEKVFVVHLAATKSFRRIDNPAYLAKVKSKYKLPDKFVLYVGDVNYNKNIPNLVEACRTVSVPLVMVGGQAKEIETMNLSHPELGHLRAIVDELKNNKNILRLGFVSDEDLVALYNLATVYCQPSFYEGFGLPVLEAFSSGTPVVASRTQALVEIGEGACAFVDPTSPRDIASGIKRLLGSGKLQAELVEAGFERVKKFSWETTAKETIKVYKSVFNQ